MLASDQAINDLALPRIDVRGLARRAAVPAVLGLGTVAAVVLLGGRVHTVAQALRRTLDGDPGWAVAGITFECISLAGYVALLSLIANRATPRIRLRESAQITFAGAAATRLLPTAGAGGAALTVWTLRRAGLSSQRAAKALLVFFVLLYSVFLGAIVVAGAALTVNAHGPTALSASAAVLAALGIAAALMLGRSQSNGRLHLIADAIREARQLLRGKDPRLAGAAVYWLFDAAVLVAMLHAFGGAPALPVVALAYFVGQVANTIPLPGSVSGGMAGVLIAFGVAAPLALPAVLAYRTIAVWLPTPAALAAIPRLRRTTAAWSREDV